MKTLFVLGVVVLCAGVGCATAPDDAAVEGSASELRELGADEILGQIEYGQTKVVEYTSSPKFRAFWFEAGKGDVVDIEVVSRDATDPIVWLTDDDFTNIASATDASPTDTRARLRRLLPDAGKYYVVFRETNMAPRAQFSVSVAKASTWPANCDPDGEGIARPECQGRPDGIDPFDPASCQGAEISADDARAKFRSTEVKPTIYYQTRQCTVINEGGDTDCSPWVRAPAMDTDLARVGNVSSTIPNLWTAAAPSGRRATASFRVGPTAVERFCVDGPFRDLRGSGWELLDDGSTSPPACTTSANALVTGSCLRFEGAPLLLNSGTPSYYTEFGTVLFAKY